MTKYDFSVIRKNCECSVNHCKNPTHEAWELQTKTGLSIKFDTKDEAKEWAIIGGYTVSPA